MGIACLSARLKRVLGEELGREPASEALLRELERVPACPRGTLIGFTGRKGKRQPNAYQQFVGECMKGKDLKSFDQAPKAMRECAARWRREQQGGEKRDGNR